MSDTIELDARLRQEEALLHEFQYRDRVKSAEYHYAVSFEFDGFFEEPLQELLFLKIKQLAKEIEFSTYKVGVSWPESMSEAQKLHLKLALQTPLIQRIEKELGKQPNFSLAHVEFLLDFRHSLVAVRLNPVYVRGRYTKFSREIAQTEFFCNKCRGRGCWYCNNTGHFSKESVEQLLNTHITPEFDAKLLIMHGAGREDMDVLMLGNGRPFIVEILLPKKRSTDLAVLTNKINAVCAGKIQVQGLEFCTLYDVAPLKDTMHDKVYAALVVSSERIDVTKFPVGEKIAVLQKTPTRVAKRRANLERSKEVTILRVGLIDAHTVVLVLRTTHGTYVKEFISGDGEKTNPSISSLTGMHCSCVLLDVLEVSALDGALAQN